MTTKSTKSRHLRDPLKKSLRLHPKTAGRFVPSLNAASTEVFVSIACLFFSHGRDDPHSSRVTRLSKLFILRISKSFVIIMLRIKRPQEPVVCCKASAQHHYLFVRLHCSFRATLDNEALFVLSYFVRRIRHTNSRGEEASDRRAQ